MQLSVGNVSEWNFNKSGKYLALVIDAADQAGNGIQLRDMTTGTIASLETDKAFYERFSWTTEGDSPSRSRATTIAAGASGSTPSSDSPASASQAIRKR